MTQADCTAIAQKGYITCPECAGTSGNARSYDYVRGAYANNWCIRCDGDQIVYIGKRAALDATQQETST